MNGPKPVLIQFILVGFEAVWDNNVSSGLYVITAQEKNSNILV